jgi:hypothetical protein
LVFGDPSAAGDLAEELLLQIPCSEAGGEAADGASGLPYGFQIQCTEAGSKEGLGSGLRVSK